MTASHRRRQRRFSAFAALAVGAVDLGFAAAVSTPIQVRAIGLGTAADVVFGARYVLLIAGLVLVLVARGLLHGKRNSWLAALVAVVASIPGHHLKDADLIGLGTATAMLVVLISCWRAFPARSDPALARRGLQVLVIGEIATLAYGAIGLYVLDAEFQQRTTLVRSLGNAGRLLFLLPTDLEPVARHGRWFIDSVRVAALAVALVALTRLAATVIARPVQRERDRPTISRLLDTYATTGLAHFQLLDDKIWFIGADGEAFIGYKVVGTVALALGEPIGAPSSRSAVAAEFVEFCDLNGWAPAFHQVTGPGAAELQSVGLHALKIGEEAVIDLRTWDLDARSFKSLRSALRRVERVGCRLAELPRPIDDETVERLRELSDSWLAAGGHRERTFTLGQFDPDQLRSTTVVAVVQYDEDNDPSSRIVAFATVLPAYRSTDGNFDLMRRRPDAPNGVMDLLFVGLIDRFRAEGRAGMNLGLAPASGIEGDSLPDRALRLLYERGHAAFNFEGLWSFKNKWNPRWEPRFLAYHTGTDLVRVAAAVARAGELPDPRSPAAKAVRVLRQFPFSAATMFVVTWLMAVTALDEGTYRHLVRHFALGWNDLLHLQLWRQPTAQLLQTRPGWVFSNLLLLVAVLPLAERRLGSLRTIVLFFGGDALSTIPVLVGLRLATALGSEPAAHALARRDGGLSSGAWVLAAALAWTMPKGRLRNAVLAGEGLVLVGLVAFRHRLFDLQHLVAALAGIGLIAVLNRRRRTQLTQQPAGAS